MDKIQNVIRYESERRKNGTDKDTYIAQIPITGEPVTRDEAMIWDALDSGINKFKSFMERYISIAEAEERAQSGDAMFQLDPVTPAAALERAAGIAPAGLSGTFYTLGDIANIKATPIPLYRMEKFLGQLIAPFKMAVWGTQGGGKSTFVNYLLDDLDKTGKTLVVLTEESLRNGRITNRVKRIQSFLTKTIFNDTLSIYQLREFLHTNHDFKNIIIDSVNMWNVTEDDLVALWNEFPDTNFIFIVQANKDGKAHRGFPKLNYLVDTEIYVSKGIATTNKHRDGVSNRQFIIYNNAVGNMARNQLLGL